MVNDQKISLCMVVYNYPELVEQAINSVRSIVDEVVIVDQGSSDDAATKIEKLADLYVYTTNKGNADYDRQYCYSFANSPFILALDSDEVIEPDQLAKFEQIFKYNFDVCWFLFDNEIVYKDKVVQLKDILGEDPHPRLWRKEINGRLTLEWPYQAHKFPAIHSQRQIFSEIHFRHRRDLEKVVLTHLNRSQNIDPDGIAVEKRFIREVLGRFGKDITDELKQKFNELSNYLKD